MRILDIDLDFFLDDIAHSKGKSLKRLNKKDYIPWKEKDVIEFLEKQIGLDKTKPVKGKFFVHHEEVFDFLKSEINKKNLTPKFSITHVDAHSDLATGTDGCYTYIMEELLHRPVKKRDEISDAKPFQKINCGNFLVFILACGWIKDLTFVMHDKTKENYNPFFFKNNDPSTNIFQFKAYKRGLLTHSIAGSTDFIRSMQPYKFKKKGSQVKFIEMNWKEVKIKKPFDLIFLTQSPNFTPKTSDLLIPIIERYIAY